MVNNNTPVDYSEYMASKLLGEALYAFSDPETVQAYNDLCKKTNTPPPKVFASVSEGLSAMSGILSGLTTFQQNAKNLQAELQKQVLALIKSGELLPVGFKLPRDSTDNPIKIPVDIVIAGEINWEKSEITYKNLEFSGIRLLEKENQKIKANKFQRSGNIVIENNKSENTNLTDLDPSQYINEKEAAKYLGISHRTLQGMRVKGGGPPFVKIRKMVRYKAGDLIKWTDGNKKENTAQY